MYWQSVQTGQYCRVVSDAGTARVLCDLPSPQAATPMEYTGTGVKYNGRPLVNPGSSQPLYFADPGTAVPPMTFTPAAGPALEPAVDFNVLSNSSGTPVRNDNSSWAAYVGAGDGTSPPERYMAYSPTDPSSSSPLPPGSPVLLKNMVRDPAGWHQCVWCVCLGQKLASVVAALYLVA